MNHRTLSAALQTGSLTGPALDFVKAGSPRPAAEPPTAFAPPVRPAEVEAPLLPAEERVKPCARPSEAVATEPEASLAAVTVRVPRVVPPGLLRASVDRKLKRQRPWTQQEIVGEALIDWLRRHGYLS